MIREWLETAVGDVTEASSGSELRVNCPFCEARIGRPDGKQHMYVSVHTPVAFCFRCGWQGNYVSLIISVSGCNYAEALKQLEAPTPNVSRFEKLFSPMGLVMGHSMSSRPPGFRFFSNQDKVKPTREEKAAWAYLVYQRNIPCPIVRKYMGWAPGTNRAWILVDGDFWQGRSIVSCEPKYISSPWPKGDAIWNPNALNDNHVIICEGVFSAIAVGSHAIALCGKTITEPQAKRIAKASPSKLTIMLDADATQFSYDMAQTLTEHGYCGQMIIHELNNGDPTDGMDGKVVSYGWGALVRNRIQLAV